MRVLVTGSSGHLGEAAVRVLRERGDDVRGVDLLPSPFTTHVGSIRDPELARACVKGVDAVIHAATLHKPHVATHARGAFVETNVAGTLTLLEAAADARVDAFVFSSTTSVFGGAMTAPTSTAVWIDEHVQPIPRNIYGVTKRAAEDLCELFARSRKLPCVVLRVGRFFCEADDAPELRERYDDANLKANEFLYRRLDLADAVEAHLLALARAPALGFGRYVLSATTPFRREHLPRLLSDAPAVVRSLFSDFDEVYEARGFRMFPGIGRVYDNGRAREDLGWQPRHDFAHVLACLRQEKPFHSSLALAVGNKGYHGDRFEEGPYPVEADDARRAVELGEETKRSRR